MELMKKGIMQTIEIGYKQVNGIQEKKPQT